MKNIWIVSEGSPGHICQSRGLADSLAALVEAEVVTVEGRENIRGWLRSSVKFTMKIRGGALSDQLLAKVADVTIPPDAGVPDLLICSGGKSVFAAKALSVKHGAPLVFIGERKHFPSEWFYACVSPVAGDAADNVIGVELIPTGVSPGMIAGRAPVEKGTWCMIIGGASRSHRYSDADWRALAEGMNAIAERRKIRWLLTTSRRTGAEAEGVIREALDAAHVIDAIWWSERERRELYDFMARSEVLCVTRDSVTMVTEAVASGRPVVAVCPQEVRFSTDSFLPDYFERLETNRRMLCVAAAELKDAAIDAFDFNPVSGDLLAPVARELVQRLGWA
jgi:uncharacterized protein